MSRLRGYVTETETVLVGGSAFHILKPVRPETLLDDPRVLARFQQDEYLPYWATLWPAARHLAEEISRRADAADLPAGPVVELGCGLGLVGLILLARGVDVLLTDYDEDALAFATESASLSNLPAPRTRCVDWRSPDPVCRAALIVAADVLYEARNLPIIARFLRAHLLPGGVALLCDPHRRHADDFPTAAADEGLEVDTRALPPIPDLPDARLFTARVRT